MKEKQKKKKVKVIYVDDGRTVYDMDNVSHPNAIIPDKLTQKQKNNKKQNACLEKKERRVAIKAAFLTYLPSIICAIAGFVATGILIYLWLS